MHTEVIQFWSKTFREGKRIVQDTVFQDSNSLYIYMHRKKLNTLEQDLCSQFNLLENFSF